MRLPNPSETRRQLEEWLSEGIAAVEPHQATLRALADAPVPATAPGILALGKAAEGMARAAIDWLANHGLEPVSGLIVSSHAAQHPHPRVRAVIGDHPAPGENSLLAAESIAEWIASLPPTSPVQVFISGGTSSLIAAPLEGITQEELRLAFEFLHGLGLDIKTMNALRRRLTRWSSGRLAAALGERTTFAWVISDVIGNDLATIGSGPMIPATVTMEDFVSALADPRVEQLPQSVRNALLKHEVAAGRPIPHRIVADGSMAAHALASAARRDGVEATVHSRPIAGDATLAGRELGLWIRGEISRHRLPPRSSGVLVTPTPRSHVVHIWHTETTVKLPEGHGRGGRAQQLALSAAQAIGGLGRSDAVTVMVAATDGRDGTTDAAGAVVDAATLSALTAAQVDVEAALSRCDAYPALDVVGALLRIGHTGTNVADLIVVRMWNWY